MCSQSCPWRLSQTSGIQHLSALIPSSLPLYNWGLLEWVSSLTASTGGWRILQRGWKELLGLRIHWRLQVLYPRRKMEPGNFHWDLNCQNLSALLASLFLDLKALIPSKKVSMYKSRKLEQKIQRKVWNPVYPESTFFHSKSHPLLLDARHWTRFQRIRTARCSQPEGAGRSVGASSIHLFVLDKLF